MLQSMTYQRWGLVFTLISAAVLITVYISQTFFGLQPCHLCLLERIPYYISLLIGFALVCNADKKTLARMLLGILLLCFIASFALGLFHLGVENKWWTYNSGCTSGSIFKKGASTKEILTALKGAAVIKCDEPVRFLFGLSMAFYNTLLSAVLISLSVISVQRRADRTATPL